jgi:hypothetical protein
MQLRPKHSSFRQIERFVAEHDIDELLQQLRSRMQVLGLQKLKKKIEDDSELTDTVFCNPSTFRWFWRRARESRTT